MNMLLEQMFEIALRNKNVKAGRFAIEWAEFEAGQKNKQPEHKDVCDDSQCNILI